MEQLRRAFNKLIEFNYTDLKYMKEIAGFIVEDDNGNTGLVRNYLFQVFSILVLEGDEDLFVDSIEDNLFSPDSLTFLLEYAKQNKREKIVKKLTQMGVNGYNT